MGLDGGVSEPDGSRWADFEIGDRRRQPFLRLYERLPEAQLYGADAYRVSGWLPADRHQVGKGGAVNWNEGLHSWCRGHLPTASSDEGYAKRVAMLASSLALLLVDWTWQPYASLC